MKNRYGLLAALIVFSSCAVSCAETSSHEAETVQTSASVSQEQTTAETTAFIDDKTSEKTAVVLSAESGFYNEPFLLELSCQTKDAVIYYTIDGSEPDLNSLCYSEPIMLKDRTSDPNVLCAETGTSAGGDYIPRDNVKKANVIRAVAVYPDGSFSSIANGTYFVGIDREKEYGEVPVISLLTDKDNLFDSEKGIYVLGDTYEKWVAEQEDHYEAWEAEGNYSQRGKEWERPVVVELITADGTEGFSQDMGVRIMGAASRSATQKSLRLTAREEYGKKAAEYEFIPNNLRSDGSGNVTKYKSFVLRNGGNDCDYAKIRDPFFQECVSGRRLETQQYAPCVVYINGEYWGMYTLVEDYSDNYIENNYGIDNKNVVMIKRGELEEGEESDISLYHDMFDFIVNNDMTVQENYDEACRVLDMGSFIDYCALNFYICNEDSIFHDNNWRMWRSRIPEGVCAQDDGKWRMMVYDIDYSAGIYSGGSNYDTNNIIPVIKPRDDKREEDHEDNTEEEEIIRKPVEMFRSLYKNSSFKQELITVMCDMRNHDFRSDKAIDRIVELSEVYSVLVPDTFSRFGPKWLARQNTKDYYNQKIYELANFIDGRYQTFPYIIQEAMNTGDVAEMKLISADGDVIVNNAFTVSNEEFTGAYITDYPVILRAVPPEGKAFLKWEYSGCELSDSSSAETEIFFSGDFSVTAVFE